MSKVYKPVKCANRECAYPKMQCVNCPYNVDVFGKHTYAAKDPKGMYKWLSGIYGKNNM